MITGFAPRISRDDVLKVVVFLVRILSVGAAVGWAAGSTGLGAAGGALVGVPAGVAAVYFRYRGSM